MSDRKKKKMVHYRQCQGHSEGLCNQNNNDNGNFQAPILKSSKRFTSS